MISFKFFKNILGMVPGNEFKIAMETAEKLNIQIVYGDRSGDQTMHKYDFTITFDYCSVLIFVS